MARGRSGFGASFGPDGSLYVVGGSEDGSSAMVHCEMLDPREGAWRPLPAMTTPRGYLSATFGLDGCLYAVGGIDMFGTALSSCEAFDPASAAMFETPQPSYKPSAFPAGGRRCVRSGLRGLCALESLPRQRAAKWRPAPPLPSPRSNLVVVCVG